MSKEIQKDRPLFGAFELALFLPSGIERFPKSKKAALYSFLIPVTLMFFWVYPLHLVPTEVMGTRSYSNLLAIHFLMIVFHLVTFLSLLWFIVRRLKRTDKFWAVVTMNNFVGIVGFLLVAPILIMVLNGFHTWEDVFGGLLLISCYELAVSAFTLTRGLDIPWQFGGALAILSIFIWDGVSSIMFSVLGI